ncbi:uncharacterized protein LOC119193333 [Manduca sexta]|uniref:uncharacterized protein LOC119193333 n=1 Tax=Manduca sexta TaxID=7130 RepID=UPI00188F0CD1|nr:uncharacterized protein LOC119193333 [Manduca sexta]
MWCSIKRICFFILTLKSLASSCDCEKNHTSKNVTGTAKSKQYFAIGKRGLDLDYSTTETSNVNISVTEVIETTNSKFNAAFNVKNISKSILTKDMRETCPYYITGLGFDIDKMADVWQTAYYRMSDRVSCFKIHIRKTSERERKRNLLKYGNFNNTVDWNSCLLEIKSGERPYAFDRKHFLQVNESSKGVFANVIFDENDDRENQTKIRLHDESADQWLVIKNLLLMRDCENGDVAVFSRVPHQPRLEDVWDALKVFGEVAMNGTLACLEDDRVQRSIKNVLQEVLFRFRLF